MCGRITKRKSPEELKLSHRIIREVRITPEIRYNLAPSQGVAGVLNDGRGVLEELRWGLIPHWAKDPKIGHKMINARVETLFEKPSFREPVKRRRCVVLADGFYEWKAGPGRAKTPYFIHRRDDRPFAIAGLWDRWHAPDGPEVKSCALVTCPANSLVSTLHDRMPAVLCDDDVERWLTEQLLEKSEVERLLATREWPDFEAYPVSAFVNAPAHDSPECLVPMAPSLL